MVGLFWRENQWPPAFWSINKLEVKRSQLRTKRNFSYRLTFFIHPYFLHYLFIMPSSLEYRDKERQRKRESRRQASQAQRERERQRARERRRNCSDEQREREKERDKERRRNFTDEQREREQERNRERGQNFWNFTEEQREKEQEKNRDWGGKILLTNNGEKRKKEPKGKATKFHWRATGEWTWETKRK